jgi:hypothetical protein
MSFDILKGAPPMAYGPEEKPFQKKALGDLSKSMLHLLIFLAVATVLLITVGSFIYMLGIEGAKLLGYGTIALVVVIVAAVLLWARLPGVPSGTIRGRENEPPQCGYIGCGDLELDHGREPGGMLFDILLICLFSAPKQLTGILLHLRHLFKMGHEQMGD